MMLSHLSWALLAALTALPQDTFPREQGLTQAPLVSSSRFGGSTGAQTPPTAGSQGNTIKQGLSLPHPSLVESVTAYNFLSPNSNSIDGGSAGDAEYTGWDFGYGTQWNNLRSRPITTAPNSPLQGDGRFSILDQSWIKSKDSFGVNRTGMVTTEGLKVPGLILTVAGSFSTYNTGGSPYGTAAGGVPNGWRFDNPANPGSMGLSHLWIDGRFWNDTDTTVTLRILGIRDGDYTVVLWLNPTNHDPLRSALVDIQDHKFRIQHIEGADYDEGNMLILDNVMVIGNKLQFDFSTFEFGGTNMDSSLAGFAAIKMK